ncbi:MAG: TolC family protein [Muribaculaceae bacterium]|nr:TolC family protein [Muribaculaceae bacterium]
MNRFIILGLLLVVQAFHANSSTLTIEDCVSKAETNYPAIRKYALLNTTLEISLSDINKGWLPRIGVYGQVTGQNVVPSFPSALSGIMSQFGQEMKGLGKFQYKVGIDVNQAIWDGGISKARREIARNQNEVETSALDVELYSVRQRVENLYFAILLGNEQISQSTTTLNLLTANLDRLKAMLRNGTAMQSDVDMVEAQALELEQTITQARFAVESYKRGLELFIGESLNEVDLICPDDTLNINNENNRPELQMFEKRISAIRASQELSDVSTMPKIGLFAQSYYGYPGLNYFNSMINREMSFNIIGGVKVSWNIDSFYTRKNSSRKTSANIETINTDRDLFLFNTDIQTTSIKENISGLRSLIDNDAKIVALRSNVRKAAESQLENGIIDTTALLSKITDENIAKLNSTYHHIKLVQEIYNLKHTLNQ